MRAVVQRVGSASVAVDGEIVCRIGRGLLVLLGIKQGDEASDARWMADKLVSLRLFADAAGKFDQSVLDARGEMLVVSQFTLYADVRKGRRPSFTDAAPPELAEPLYREVIARVGAHGVPVAGGRFGARMHVALVNDGPVTVVVESPARD